MERMYQTYKDIAEFYIVYISEAHAMDDRSPVPYAKDLGIKEHKTYGERCRVADRLTIDKKLTIPCLIDGMDNAVEAQYHGHPDRVFLVRKDGKLAIAARRGPWGFAPAMRASQDWLASYRRTGVEPAIEIPDEDFDAGEAQRDLATAYQRRDYETALKIAKRLHNAEPRSPIHIYNAACMYCLLGATDDAYTWLEKAVDAGYDDADQLLADDDFNSIRNTGRFKKLVERTRDNVRAREARRLTPDAAETAVGTWTMTTTFNGRTLESGMTIRYENGFLVGTWRRSDGKTVDMEDLTLDGRKLAFNRTMGEGMDMTLRYEGTIDGDTIDGQYTTPFGTLDANGRRNHEKPKPGSPGATAHRGTDSKTSRRIVGDWDMETKLGDRSIDAVMTLTIKDGRLTGVWKSMGREMPLSDIAFDGTTLSFKRSIGPEQELTFTGTLKRDKINGKYAGPFGDIESNGERRSGY